MISKSANGWISFSERMPEPAYDVHKPGPTHGYILVTNALDARNRWGMMSHVWLTGMVHRHKKDDVFNGQTLACKGEITCFVEPGGQIIRMLTHWRPAVPEEWPNTQKSCCSVGSIDVGFIDPGIEGEPLK